MTGKFFKTSFGHAIPVADGYRAQMPPPRDNASPMGASSITQSGGVKGPKENPFGIMSDIFQYAFFADWLATTPIAGRKFECMLDIGGCTGLMSQLFKASGMVREAHNIEILDYSDALDHDLVRHTIGKIRTGHQELTGQSAFDARLWKLRAGAKSRQVWLLNQLRFLESTFPYPITEHSHLWKLSPNLPLGLDRDIIGDFFELKEPYDFLLCVTTMQHFSVEAFLHKAKEIMAPGGVLLVWNAYWYWALLVNRLYGDFPWGAQRLTWDDYERYLAEYQPDQIENARKSVNMFHKAELRYTVNDYLAAAEKVGLKHLAHHRLMPSAGLPAKIGAWTLKGDHGPSVQQEVLRDIHCFRPDVEAKDLVTQSVFLLFQKD